MVELSINRPDRHQLAQEGGDGSVFAQVGMIKCGAAEVIAQGDIGAMFH